MINQGQMLTIFIREIEEKKQQSCWQVSAKIFTINFFVNTSVYAAFGSVDKFVDPRTEFDNSFICSDYAALKK